LDRLTQTALVAFALLGLTASARAAEPTDDSLYEPAEERPAEGYNGTYIGAFAGGALGLLDAPTEAGTIGGGAIAGARVGLVLNLIDVALAYRYTGYEIDGESLDRHGAWLLMRVHPAFVKLVGGRYIDYLMSALYVQVGGHFDHASGPADGWGGGVLLGGGIDLPVGIPTGAWSLWAELSYVRSWRWPDADGAPGLPSLDEHVFTVSLGIRQHGLRFARVPRPTEFRFR
jgi:hypothetical protein